MMLPPAPQPRYWKALAFAAIPVGFILWTIFARSSLPPWIGWGLWAGVTAAVAGIIHARMTNDWRTRYEMNLLGFERRANVGHNVRVKKS